MSKTAPFFSAELPLLHKYVEDGIESLQSNIILNQSDTGIIRSVRFTPVTYILDYINQKYIHVDETCFGLTGFSAAYFIKEGLQAFVKKWHPIDFQVINDKIVSKNLRFIEGIPGNEFRNYIFSHNYRLQHCNGEYRKVLQRSIFIPGIHLNRPIGVVGIIIDITHFKNDDCIVHTIEKQFPGEKMSKVELLFKQVYEVDRNFAFLLLSDREREILRLMAEGYTSKQISKSLGISIYTVHNHRKNLLQKTGAKSTPELLHIAFAFISS